MLEHGVQDLHVVRIPRVGELVEQQELDEGSQVVLVGIQQLPACDTIRTQQEVLRNAIR